MASGAFSGVGTLFRRWNGSSWANIAEVTSISGPTMTRETIDVTSLDTTGGYREFIGGFRDGGTVQLSMNFTAATYGIMKGDFEDDTDLTKNYEILLKDPAGDYSLEFAGVVTECPIEVTADDKVTSTVTIKVSGEVTEGSGSGSG